MKKSNEKCSVCGEPLTSPFAKNRGVCDGCSEKSGEETIQK